MQKKKGGGGQSGLNGNEIIVFINLTIILSNMKNDKH